MTHPEPQSGFQDAVAPTIPAWKSVGPNMRSELDPGYMNAVQVTMEL